MAEAAEDRYRDQQHRGIKNLDSVKRLQQRSLKTEKYEKDHAMAGGGNLNVKWTQE